MQPTSVARPSATPDDLVETFHEFMGRLMCSVAQQSLGTMLSSDLTAHQFHILLNLTDTDAPVPITRLADDLGISVAATGRNVEKLVQLDLIDRREDSADRRVKKLTLTDLGRKTVATTISDKHRAVQNFAHELPGDLRDRLHHVMADILELGIIPPSPIFDILKENS